MFLDDSNPRRKYYKENFERADPANNLSHAL